FVAAAGGAHVAATRFFARPHMASAALTALFLLWLFRHRSSPDRRVVWIVPLAAVWANLHSAVVLGLFVVGVFALDEWVRLRRPGLLVPVGLGAGAAAMLNPHGWTALWYPFFLLRANDGGQFDILELRPPDWPSEVHAYVGVLCVAAALAGRALSLPAVVLAGVGAVLGLTRKRASLDLALFAAPLLSLGLTGAIRLAVRLARLDGIAARVPVAGAAAAVVAAVLAGLGWRPTLEVVPWAIPAGAMRFVEANGVGGQMFNAHAFGAWLLWAHPDRKVYFDGRNEVFVDLFTETRDTPLATLSERYDLGYALLDYPSDHDVREVEIPVDLHDALIADPAWALVYFDDVARLYVRDRPENRAVLARAAYRWLRPGWTDFAYVARYAADPRRAAAFEVEARRAVAEAPGAVMPRMHLVELLRLTGRVEEALRELDAVPPGDPFALSRRGGLLLAAGRAPDALRALEHAAERLPDNAAVWSNLGLARMRGADLPGAIAAYRRAIELDPELIEARRNLALALERAGDLDGARAARNELAVVSRDLARRHFEGGQKLLAEGYAERAAVELERAVALAPGSANAHYLLGVALNQLGEPARAEAELTATLGLDGAHPYALYELADARMAQGRRIEAVQTLTAFLSTGPEPRWEARAQEKLVAWSAEGGAP
ncbi:MAG: tetratricopeptide repeat protein, partial [Myxococcota bacterium]